MTNNKFEDSFLKEDIRIRLAKDIVRHHARSRKIKYFGLCGAGVYFEEELNDRCLIEGKKIEMTCVERDKSIYLKAQKSIVDHNLTSLILHQMTDVEYLRDNPGESFNALFVDHCGTYQTFMETTFPALMEGDHFDWRGENPVLAVTFCAARDGKSESGQSYVDRLLLRREEAVPKIIYDLSRTYGRSVVPRIVRTYLDHSGGRHKATPMLFVVFEVFKGTKTWKGQLDFYDGVGKTTVIGGASDIIHRSLKRKESYASSYA